MPNQKAYIGVKSIKNEVNETVLELHFTDFIYDGFDWNTWESINLVQDTIDKIKAANPTKIKIIINSLGGDVMIGLALYNYLKAHAAEKQVDVIGFAASIASVIAMCASPGKLRMAKSSFMIIHAAWGCACGNAAQIMAYADSLDKVTNEMAEIYALRSGKEASYFIDSWKDGDHWLTASECKDLGLCDEVFNAEPISAKVDFTKYEFKNIPAALIKAESQPADQNTFFSNLNNRFMKLIDEIKAAVTGGKKDEKFKDVPNRDAILDMIDTVFGPVAARMDAVLANAGSGDEKPKAEIKPAAEVKAEETTTTTETTSTEKKEEPKTEVKKEEKKEEATVTEDPEIKALKDRIAQQDVKINQLLDAKAGNETLPEAGAKGKAALSKVKVEYEAA